MRCICLIARENSNLKKLSLKINLDWGGIRVQNVLHKCKCIGDTSHVFFIITCTVIYATRNVHFRTLCLFLLCSSHSCRFQFNRQNFCKLRKSRDTRSAASVAADIEGDPLRMALAKELSPPMMWLVAAARNSWKSTAFLIRLSRSLRDVSTTAIKHAWTKLLTCTGFMSTAF